MRDRDRRGRDEVQLLHLQERLPDGARKIGKGTGKQVGRLREEARKTLGECRAAVPVWIMPLSRVIESFDLATTRFDVVIIDEASQSDVLGLVALAMAKAVAVVGDHEQVSPYAVGFAADTIQGLIDASSDRSLRSLLAIRQVDGGCGSERSPWT